MHTTDISPWEHSHHYSIHSHRSERKTWLVIGITLVMMIAEIAGGYLFGSMALLADGWHMGTHAAALGIAAFAYWYTRHNATNPRYSFGIGKVGVLGGYSSAIVLAVVAFIMLFESVTRLLHPGLIRFNEALFVAAIGLLVNVICAFILQESHSHASSGNAHTHHHHDHNLRSAYFHVLADALTSVLAIIALLCGKAFGWIQLDPVMGIVGAAVILRWAYALLKDTCAILLDASASPDILAAVRDILEAVDDTRVADLHVWQVGSQHFSAIVSLVSAHPQPPRFYKELLQSRFSFAHLTLEINPCSDTSSDA